MGNWLKKGGWHSKNSCGRGDIFSAEQAEALAEALAPDLVWQQAGWLTGWHRVKIEISQPFFFPRNFLTHANRPHTLFFERCCISLFSTRQSAGRFRASPFVGTGSNVSPTVASPALKMKRFRAYAINRVKTENERGGKRKANE